MLKAAPGLRPIAIFAEMVRRRLDLGEGASDARSNDASALGARFMMPSRMSSSSRRMARPHGAVRLHRHDR